MNNRTVILHVPFSKMAMPVRCRLRPVSDKNVRPTRTVFVDTMDQVLAVALEQALPVVELPAEQPTIPSMGDAEAPSAHQ